MPRRGSEVSEGTDDSNGVYGFIRDLLVDGKDAWFVNGTGRYGLNWCRALDCYADYKARKKPQFKSKNLTRQKLSNHLRSALLNFYKKDGAKEYMESKKVNNKNEVVERQFQMPSKLFKSFFGSTVPSDESEQQDEQEINSTTSEDEIDVQSTHNSSDHGFDETMDQSCVDVQSTHNSSDHGFDETMDQSCVGETNSSPQDENPLNGGPNTVTHSTTSYLCPNNASQMFPTLSDTWHQELLDSANMNIVDGHPSMEIQPEATVHQDQVGADCNGNSPTEEFDSLTTATDLNIKSRNSSQECDLDHSVVQRIIPPSGSVEGGYPFVIALSEPLPGQVNFGEAKFHGVTTVNLEKLNNHTFSGTVPRCHLAEPGIVEVTVMTQTGQHLGKTSFEYVDELTKIAKQITVDHGKQAKFFSKLSEEHKVLSGSSLQSKQQHSLQFLQFLVYTASQTGAKTFIEIIFSTSAGQIVFDSYKDRTCLPEDVARASGHDELANYLQDLTTRFSKEPEFSRKEAHVIDWSELEGAAIAAQTQGCLTEEKSSDDSSENNSDTDYFADVETSSIDSSELSRSTSEDDTSEPNSRDKTKASAHQSISSIGKWASAGNGTMEKIGQIKEGMKQKSCVLILRDSHFDSSLPEVVKGLDYTLAFHLAIGSKNIPCHLHTVNERFLVLRESITRQPTMSFCKLHPYPDVLKESSLVKNNKGFISKTVASKQRHWNQLNEDTFAELGTLMPNEKDIAVEWKSSCTFGKQFGAHTHCDLWVFISAFLPTRKTFFIYFADRRDALPPSYFFEDEDCESQVACWKWQRSGNKSLNFTERLKEKELPPGREESHMESHADLPVTYIVRDKQAQAPSESGICLSWMHAMMHHCWTTESTEKASNIILFDHFLGLSKETECEDQPKTINWLELVKAVQNETSDSSVNENKQPGSSVANDDNTSDYFADAETSSLGSMEPDDACPSDSEEEDAANKGLKSTFGFSKPFSDDTSSNGRFLIGSASIHIPDEDFKKGLPPFYIGLLDTLVFCVVVIFSLLFQGLIRTFGFSTPFSDDTSSNGRFLIGSGSIHSPDEDFEKGLPPFYIGLLDTLVFCVVVIFLLLFQEVWHRILNNASSEGRCDKGPEFLQDNNTGSSRRRYSGRKFGGILLAGAFWVLGAGFMLSGLISTFGFSKPFSDDTSSNGRFLIGSASIHIPDEDFKKGLPPFYIGLCACLVSFVFRFFFLLFQGLKSTFGFSTPFSDDTSSNGRFLIGSASIHSPDEDFKKGLPPFYIGLLDTLVFCVVVIFSLLFQGLISTFGFSKPFSDDTSSNGRFLIGSGSIHSPDEDFKKGLPPFDTGLLAPLVSCFLVSFLLLFQGVWHIILNDASSEGRCDKGPDCLQDNNTRSSRRRYSGRKFRGILLAGAFLVLGAGFMLPGLKSTFGFSKPFSDDTSSNGRFLIDSASIHSPDEDFKKGLPPFYIGLLAFLVPRVLGFFFLLFQGVWHIILNNASSEGRCDKGPECLQDNNTRSSRRRYSGRKFGGILLAGAFLVLGAGFMLPARILREVLDMQKTRSSHGRDSLL
ncbi:uncharacterized protein [Montipora capricornis]|uniref:uncharacterized protein n=1 Tax=Montipora capricornis TaxID=246305 RepID=UPI0035F1E070